MTEQPLTDQDAEMLAEALRLLLSRTEDIKELSARRTTVSDLLETVRSMSGVELPQAVLNIKRALNEIASELDPSYLDTQI